MVLTGRRRLLVLGNADAELGPLLERAVETLDIVAGDTPLAAGQESDLVLLSGDLAHRSDQLKLCARGLLDNVPDGLILLDERQQIIWHNEPCRLLFESPVSLAGQYFSALLTGTDTDELSVAELAFPGADGEVVRSQVRLSRGKWLGFRSRRCRLNRDGAGTVVLSVRDVTAEVLERQQLEAIYRAGLELGNLSPDEVTGMSNEERLILLKENILNFTQEILGYETFEIRLLNHRTEQLVPLLEFGMNPEAAARCLYARPADNGVTGYVASSGSSYLCNDTQIDPLYLCGAEGARSSLTVPLMLRDQVLGTFNVESAGTAAFSQRDLEFLQLFGRVVANALNQLQLLLAEKVSTAAQNSDRLRREISQPTDEILRDATWILERYIGHDPDVSDRLHRIVSATRQISGQVDQVPSSEVTAAGLDSSGVARPIRPALIDKRVLVVDGDAVAREDAHTLLGQMGCHVEGVPNSDDACMMARSHHYDVVLTDIRLPDVSGYECFRRIRTINSHVPIIMMTGFGYDPTHSIVNARKEGLKAVLYKPFRRGQLLDEVEKACTAASPPPDPAAQ